MMRFLLGIVIGVVAATLVQFVVLAPRPSSATAPAGDYDLELRVGEPFLARSIQQSLAETPLASQIRDIRVEVQPSARLRLLAQASASGISAPVAATVQASAVDGAVHFEVTGLELGGLRVPASVPPALERRLNEQIQSQLGGLSYRAVSVATEDRELVVGLRQ